MQSLALRAIPDTKYGLKPGNVEAFDLDPVYGIMLITVLVLRDLEGVRVWKIWSKAGVPPCPSCSTGAACRNNVWGQQEQTLHWLVVWNIFYFPFHIWDNPSHRLIFFKMVKTTNQYIIDCCLSWICCYSKPTSELWDHVKRCQKWASWCILF